jgi:hypothetical protein
MTDGWSGWNAQAIRQQGSSICTSALFFFSCL